MHSTVGLLSGSDDGDELRLEGGTANQEAVDVDLPSEVWSVLAVGTATVQDSDRVCELADLRLEVGSDFVVDVLRVLCSGRQTCADGPDRLVRNDDLGPVVLLDGLEHCCQFSLTHFQGLACLLLVDGLADTENDLQALLDGEGNLVGDKLVGLVEDASTFAVAENDPFCAGVLHLQRRNLTGEGARFLDIAILRPDRDRLLLVELSGVGEIWCWWTEHDLDVVWKVTRVEVIDNRLDGRL